MYFYKCLEKLMNHSKYIGLHSAVHFGNSHEYHSSCPRGHNNWLFTACSYIFDIPSRDNKL